MFEVSGRCYQTGSAAKQGKRSINASIRHLLVQHNSYFWLDLWLCCLCWMWWENLLQRKATESSDFRRPVLGLMCCLLVLFDHRFSHTWCHMGFVIVDLFWSVPLLAFFSGSNSLHQMGAWVCFSCSITASASGVWKKTQEIKTGLDRLKGLRMRVMSERKTWKNIFKKAYSLIVRLYCKWVGYCIDSCCFINLLILF